MTARTFRIGLVVVLAVTMAGLIAPRWVRSPAQVAADRAAPVLPPATAAVERRVLTATVALRGTVTTERRTDVVAVAAEGGRAVVTGLRVRAGERVPSGRVLVEVSGRPVILLEGPLPAYRDLRTGAEGPDVSQLQGALQALGYPVTDARGRFGATTTAAVRRLYADRGYDPPPGEPPTSVRLPVAEVVFLAGLPGRVDRLSTSLGATPTSALMTLSSGRAVVTGTLAPGDRTLVHVGLRARIRSESLGVGATGSVASIGRLDAGTAGPPGYPLRVEPSAELDDRLLDQDVLLTIVAARTRGPVLVVPLSAVTARADGSSVVSVLPAGADDAASARVVAVRLGLDTDGYVAVTAVDGGALRAGDRVVVGVRS